jgi:hypothetical protein
MCKMRNLASITVLALSGMVLAAPSARAQTVTAGTADLILGFSASGGTGSSTNFEIDLGQGRVQIRGDGTRLEVRTGPGARI